MLAIPFEGSRPIAKPPSMTDEQCSSLQILTGVSPDPGILPDEFYFDPVGPDFPFFLSCWQPSPEDIERIKNGEPVWLKIVGKFHPPVAVFTFDKESNNSV